MANLSAMMKILDEGHKWRMRVTSARIETLSGYDLEFRKQWDADTKRLEEKYAAEWDKIFGTNVDR